MPHTEIEVSITGDRKGLRANLVNIFMEEVPGTGKGELSTSYCYIVESTISGYQVQLLRPAFLNKGIDFVVNVPGVQFNTNKIERFRTVPRHDDVISLMSGLQEKYPKSYPFIAAALRSVYYYDEPDVSTEHANLKCALVEGDEVGIPADVGILAIKWFFAEQDLTYWNFSGCAMLYSKLESEGLID